MSASPRITFTVHAVTRYIERVRPGIDPATARLELAALTEFGQIVDILPDRFGLHQGPSDSEHADLFLLVADVAFPLQTVRGQLIATTCATAGSIRDEVREDRRNRRRRHMPKRLHRDGRKARRHARTLAEETS